MFCLSLITIGKSRKFLLQRYSAFPVCAFALQHGNLLMQELLAMIPKAKAVYLDYQRAQASSP